MHQSSSKNKRKRTNLEFDYDTYSSDLIHHTLNGRSSKKDAKILHDRAITLLDIAKIYLENKQYYNARTCVKSAINDLLKAIDIYKQLNSAKTNTSIKSYKKLLKVLRAYESTMQNLLELPIAPGSPIVESIDDRDKETPQTPIRNKKTKYQSISPDIIRHTRGNCGLFGCDNEAKSDSSSTGPSARIMKQVLENAQPNIFKP